MKKNGIKRNFLIIIFVLIILLVIIGITYAFFVTTFTNNTTSGNVSTNNVSLIYTDCGSSNNSGDNNHCSQISASLKPGDSVEKTFKVQNTGDAVASYTIYFRRLLNTFSNNDLVYTLIDITNPSSPVTVIEENTPVPYKTVEDNNIVIINNNTVAINAVREYKMIITFLDRPIDQSYNSSAQFLIQVGINEYIPPVYLVSELKEKANNVSNTDYSSSTTAQRRQMYVFNHEATNQTPALTDYRYIGAGPYNYVKYNCTNMSDISTCETWRILGVFNVDDGNGNYSERVKLIRDSSINTISWDTDESRGGSKVNNWVGSNLAKILNIGDYYTRSNAYSSNGLTQSAKSMISNVKWYLGGMNQVADKTGEIAYGEERGTKVTVNTTNDINTNIYSVGIMYPSDYIFTYANGVDSTCYENSNSCGNSVPSSSWLRRSANEWLITPRVANASYAWRILSGGSVNSSGGTGIVGAYAVRPVVYLNPNVELNMSIENQNGSSENPYVLKS